MAPRLEPFKASIDAMLTADLTAPRKPRHTVRRVLARLVAENAAGDLSYSTVRDYVAVRRREASRYPITAEGDTTRMPSPGSPAVRRRLGNQSGQWGIQAVPAVARGRACGLLSRP
ncbi:hypothetical protein [Actinoplanes regularis]|uniref:hypothetical protein n=1 Tax=Actinoplanes regularis TaxID=52697 RepID=UPI0011784539|nr:hypothetical protein [Actinoplanes regularis]